MNQLNGTAKIQVDNVTDSKLWRAKSFKNKPSERDVKDENKSSFSEKLKLLLENGSVNEKVDDPYTFQDVDHALESFDCIKTLPNSAMDGLAQTNFKEKVYFENNELKAPTSTKNVAAALKCVVTLPIPVYNQMTSSSFNVAPSDILPRHPSEAAKVRSPLLMLAKSAQSATTSGQLRFPNTISKNVQKSTNPANSKSTTGGKPVNFGKSLMSKLAIAKIEKTLEQRSKIISKSSVCTSNHKTASINRLFSKPKRPATARSASLDSDVTAKNESKRNKLRTSKSVLEESLLGLKPCDDDEKWGALPKTTSILDSLPELNMPPHTSVCQKSLLKVRALRDQIKLIKRDHQQIGLLLDDEPECHDLDSGTQVLHFQNYWFSLCNDYDSFAGHHRKREVKLAQLKTELRHKLMQQQWRLKDDYRKKMAKLLIDTAREMPNLAAVLIHLGSANQAFKYKLNRANPIERRECTYTENGTAVCRRRALPSATSCIHHIVQNPSQLMFSPCAAAIPPDDRICSAPALGKEIGLGLCIRHSRLQPSLSKSNQMMSEKSNIQGKRSRSSFSASRPGRARKRKRQLAKDKKGPKDEICKEPCKSACISEDNQVHNLPSDALVVLKSGNDESQDVEVGEEVLPLDSAELASLATQDTRLLEEHDFTNVLNHIPADAFNDLFTEDKEEYEPTPQETEELERALEAVDNDVKSLEKLSQTHAFLEMLDEHSIAQTLAALPEVVPALYHNGFSGISPLEPSICDPLPHPLLISPQTDVLQS